MRGIKTACALIAVAAVLLGSIVVINGSDSATDDSWDYDAEKSKYTGDPVYVYDENSGITLPDGVVAGTNAFTSFSEAVTNVAEYGKIVLLTDF